MEYNNLSPQNFFYNNYKSASINNKSPNNINQNKQLNINEKDSFNAEEEAKKIISSLNEAPLNSFNDFSKHFLEIINDSFVETQIVESGEDEENIIELDSLTFPSSGSTRILSENKEIKQRISNSIKYFEVFSIVEYRTKA